MLQDKTTTGHHTVRIKLKQELGNIGSSQVQCLYMHKMGIHRHGKYKIEHDTDMLKLNRLQNTSKRFTTWIMMHNTESPIAVISSQNHRLPKRKF
jgi:hypothetical protein